MNNTYRSLVIRDFHDLAVQVFELTMAAQADAHYIDNGLGPELTEMNIRVVYIQPETYDEFIKIDLEEFKSHHRPLYKELDRTLSIIATEAWKSIPKTKWRYHENGV